MSRWRIQGRRRPQTQFAGDFTTRRLCLAVFRRFILIGGFLPLRGGKVPLSHGAETLIASIRVQMARFNPPRGADLTDLAKIKAELTADPDGRGYAGMDDAAAAADMDAKRFFAEYTPKEAIERYMLEEGKWPAIEDLMRDTAATIGQRRAARAFVRLLKSSIDTVRLDRPKVGGMMDLLVASGAITAADKAAVMALRTPISWAEREGISVGEGAIWDARNN